MQPVVVIPNELPPSRTVYVLTTSEGRDKLFKLLQYMLLAFVKVLQQENLIPSQRDSREYWTKRFTQNLTTLRFGRCLFRLGRWLITIVYLQMSVRFLLLLLRARRKQNASARGGAPSRLQICLASLLVLRSCASVCRSFFRDLMFLSDTNFSSYLRLPPGVQATTERAQQLLWVTTSLADCILVEYRLSLAGWVPDLRSLRCACDPARAASLGDARFQFTPVDLDFGCPHPLVPSFFSALHPAEMPVVCSSCDQLAVPVSGLDESSSSSSAVLFVPNMVRRGFEYVTVLGAHDNLREMLLLRVKSFCELVLSLALATHSFKHFSSYDVNAGEFPRVAWTTTLCGMVSSMISLHRVWLAAK